MSARSVSRITFSPRTSTISESISGGANCSTFLFIRPERDRLSLIHQILRPALLKIVQSRGPGCPDFLERLVGDDRIQFFLVSQQVRHPFWTEIVRVEPAKGLGD